MCILLFVYTGLPMDLDYYYLTVYCVLVYIPTPPQLPTSVYILYVINN